MSEEKKSLFKFRAWDKLNESMCDVGNIDFMTKVVELRNDVPFYFLPFSEVVLMQSTGLKDKNDVEIFEGDIIKYRWDSPIDISATEEGKKVRISKVFWSDWRASWAVGKKSGNSDLFRYIRNGNTVEVIGNIWENEELLKMVK